MQNKQFPRDRKQNRGYQGLEGRGDEKVLLNEYRVSVRGGEQFWKKKVIMVVGHAEYN